MKLSKKVTQLPATACVQRQYRGYERRWNNENIKEWGSINERTNSILPYIRGYSEKIELFCRKLNV